MWYMAKKLALHTGQASQLLLKYQRRAANSLPFKVDYHFDTVYNSSLLAAKSRASSKVSQSFQRGPLGHVRVSTGSNPITRYCPLGAHTSNRKIHGTGAGFELGIPLRAGGLRIATRII